MNHPKFLHEDKGDPINQWCPKDVSSIKKVVCAGIFYEKLDVGDLADLKEWLIDYLKEFDK